MRMFVQSVPVAAKVCVSGRHTPMSCEQGGLSPDSNGSEVAAWIGIVLTLLIFGGCVMLS
jgi:hypothetical protein